MEPAWGASASINFSRSRGLRFSRWIFQTTTRVCSPSASASSRWKLWPLRALFHAADQAQIGVDVGHGPAALLARPGRPPPVCRSISDRGLSGLKASCNHGSAIWYAPSVLPKLVHLLWPARPRSRRGHGIHRKACSGYPLDQTGRTTAPAGRRRPVTNRSVACQRSMLMPSQRHQDQEPASLVLAEVLERAGGSAAASAHQRVTASVKPSSSQPPRWNTIRTCAVRPDLVSSASIRAPCTGRARSATGLARYRPAITSAVEVSGTGQCFTARDRGRHGTRRNPSRNRHSSTRRSGG